MKIKNYILSLLLILGITLLTKAQSGISLYHLNNSTIQGNHFNPAFIPEGRFFLGLPVISGVMIDINSPVSYNDLVTTNEAGNSEYDFSNVANIAKRQNFISAEAEISSFYIGFRPKKSFAVSFFIRERIAARVFYDNDLVQFAWHGNKNFVNKEINLSNTIVDARYYREYGLGIWKSIPNKGINFGFRAKLINGMFSVISDPKMNATLRVGESYEHDLDFQNARVNMSGMNILKNDDGIPAHLVSNGNLGVGIDIGAHWKINEQLSASIAANDLGFINWKVDADNGYVKDSTFRFEGIDLKNVDDFGNALSDSLINRFQDSLSHESYISGLNTSLYGSMMFQLTDNDLFTASISSHIVQDQYRTLYALGYTRKIGDILKLSGNIIRTPQQSVDLGLAAAVNLGPVQLYLASDKVVRVWDVPNASAFDFRFGINFIFGREKTIVDDRSDLQHPSGYSKNARIEKSDGIYWIIRKQKPRPIYQAPKSFGR